MDQTTSTVVHATEEFLRDSLAKATLNVARLEEYVKQLQSAHANTVIRSTDEAAERSRMRNEMQEWTLEALETGTINQSEGQEIADICGFELTKEFEVEATVLYSITVNARDEESAINLIHEIDFDSVSEPEGVIYLSSSVDRVDI
jgi:uncharacterized radical SAM superfamily Fe-S cluster-containing enzyme